LLKEKRLMIIREVIRSNNIMWNHPNPVESLNFFPIEIEQVFRAGTVPCLQQKKIPLRKAMSSISTHKPLACCKDEKHLRVHDQNLAAVKEELFEIEMNMKRVNNDLNASKNHVDDLKQKGLDSEQSLIMCKHLSMNLDHLETSRDKIRNRIHKLSKQDVEPQSDEKTDVSKLFSRSEKKVALKIRSLREQEVVDLESRIEEQNEIHAKKVLVARDERRKARRRVETVNAKKAGFLNRATEMREENQKKRVNAVVSLKNSTEVIQRVIQNRNSKQSEKLARRQERESKEFDAIIASGGNPYEVFRKREQDARVQKAREAIAIKLKQSEMKAAEKMIALDAYIRSKDAADTEEKQYAQVYTKSLGRHVAEENTRKYMQSRTIGRVDTIDPSGRAFRIEPSQVTLTKTHAFGLGKNTSKDIIDLIAARPNNRGVESNLKLIPRHLREHLPESTEVSSKMQSSSSNAMEEHIDEEIIPGANHLQVSHTETDAERELVRSLDSFQISKYNPSSPGRTAKKYQLRKPSVLEENMLHQARKCHLDGMVQDQIVLGKKFEGQAFISEPKLIHFKDFQPGKTYKTTFVLTNASFSFSSFKVLPLPEALKNFLVVSYTNPGRLSAGMTCKIHLEFEPQVDTDINVSIPFLADTGPFEVPVLCTKRRVVPVLSSNCLDFQTVILGEKKTMQLKLSNNGVLESNFDVFFRNETDIFRVRELTGVIPGYSSRTISVAYKPVACDSSMDESELSIKFTNGFGYPEETLHVSILGKRSQVPIYVEHESMDFNCVIIGKLYRNKLVLRNRGKVSLRVTLKPPAGLEKCLEFSPSMGFVQGRENELDGKLEIQIKFRPIEELIMNEIKHVEIPLVIHIPDQVLPVKFTINSTVTTSEIQLQPEILNFGHCYTSQSTKAALNLKNCSLVPQKIGFVHLKSFVQVPNGFTTILPMSNASPEIVFSPTSASEYSFSLTMKTSSNELITVPCHGVGIDPPLEFSHHAIQFGAIGLGSRSTQSIFVKNKSNEPRTFEMVLPNIQREDPCFHHLRISPSVVTLLPRQNTRIEIAFDAPTERITANQEDTNVSFSDEGEPWSMHGEWLVSCFVQNFPLPLNLSVSTVVTDAILSTSHATVEFDQLAVGNIVTKLLHITNISKTTSAKLESNGLNPVGPFTVVNSLRDIGPGDSFPLLVKFQPLSNRVYNKNLIVRTKSGGMVNIQLTGQGVSPELSMDKGIVDIGNVFVNEIGTGELVLKNESDFYLDYTIQSKPQSNSYFNESGRQTFTFSPQQSRMIGGQSQKVHIEFISDQEILNSHCVIMNVKVPNQAEEQVFKVRARCWKSPLFALVNEGGSIAASDTVVDEFQLESTPRNYSIGADFNQNGVVCLQVGSCCSTKGGTFEMVIDSAAMVVDKPKGNIKPKTSEKISFTLKDSQALGVHTATCILQMDTGITRRVHLRLRKQST